jgi:hypothetical protein
MARDNPHQSIRKTLIILKHGFYRIHSVNVRVARKGTKRRISMSIDKNDPGNTSDDQAAGQIEELEPSEIDGVDLETINGGGLKSPGVAPTGGCPVGYTL